MVISTFFLSDKDDREIFFKETFLLDDVNPHVVLKIPFFTMSKVNIDF